MKRDFAPPSVTLKDVHDAVPKHLLKRNMLKSAVYIAGDLAMAVALFGAAVHIDRVASSPVARGFGVAGWQLEVGRWMLWGMYWWFQGLVWAGLFCLGEFVLFHAIIKPSDTVMKVTMLVLVHPVSLACLWFLMR